MVPTIATAALGISKPRVIETTLDSEEEEDDEEFSDNEDGDWDDVQDIIESDDYGKQLVLTKEPIKKKKKKLKLKKVKKVRHDSTSDSNSDSPIDDGVIDNDSTVCENVGSGLANVFGQILSKEKNHGILSKARKDRDNLINKDPSKRKVDDVDYEVVQDGIIKKIKTDDEKPNKLNVKTEKDLEKQFRIKQWEEMCLVKPDYYSDKDKERKLRVIATQGVVQLFSAIEKHSKEIQKKISETRGVIQREKVLAASGKDAFLDILWTEGQKSQSKVTEVLNNHDTDMKDELKDEIKEELETIPAAEEKRWKVLTQEFYKEPTLDEWDKGDSDEE